MRINVYHHEIDTMVERAEWVSTTADTGNQFYGVRFPTEPPLMHQPGDDDSSAVTVWVPWTKSGGHDIGALRRLFTTGLELCSQIEHDIAGSGQAQ